MPDMESLPGGALITAGLRDLANSRESVASLVVSMAVTRLRELGLQVPPTVRDPELCLCPTRSEQYGDAAHGRFNALSAELVSFQRALACVA